MLYGQVWQALLANEKGVKVYGFLDIHYRGDIHHKKWGCSSVGRAPASHAGGQGFNSPHLHHLTLK